MHYIGVFLICEFPPLLIVNVCKYIPIFIFKVLCLQLLRLNLFLLIPFILFPIPRQYAVIFFSH